MGCVDRRSASLFESTAREEYIRVTRLLNYLDDSKMTVKSIERGQLLRLELEGMGRLGEALAYLGDKPVFVFGGIPGEEVEVEIIRERRHYIAAEVVNVIRPSPHRQQPPCRYFTECTGCQWQHVAYSHQLQLKRQAVEDALQRVGGLSDVPVSPTLPSPREFGYRNHARFTVSREGGRLGYIHRERRRFIDIERCLLMNDYINDVLSQLDGHCGETTQVAVRSGARTGSRLIQPTLKGEDVPLETGQKTYMDSVLDIHFRVASPSFFQVNTEQLENIVGLVKESLGLTGSEVLIDAYAGVGTFAGLLAPYASKVIAIEESAASIEDAQYNLRLFNNIEIRKGKTEEVLQEITEPVDAMIIDPPRAGCQKAALESIVRLAPQRLIYVSCDPATLARDLRILSGPFRIASVQPVDMFPQTYHVECLATLTLRPGHPITLASASPRRRQILREHGIPFNLLPSESEEPSAEGNPKEYTQRVALHKARNAAERVRQGLVLAADTVVVDGNRVLGKPQTEPEAMEMLLDLLGGTHEVITGVVILDSSSGESRSGYLTSKVTMRHYSEDEARAWVESGQAMDKAGAYAIQDDVFSPVASVEGCYLNVMGLPMCLSTDLLRQMGADLNPPPEMGSCETCRLGGETP